MRFRASIHNGSTFASVFILLILHYAGACTSRECSASYVADNLAAVEFTASLASLGNIAWVRLSSDDVRFTIIPERGTQVWSQIAIDTIFETYTIQSASPGNAINLEVPLAPLLRALRSASQAKSASIRLTKKDAAPWLCMTIIADPTSSSRRGNGFRGSTAPGGTYDDHDAQNDILQAQSDKEIIITQDIPVTVMPPESVAGLHEPRCREPDVHIYLPPLAQLKAISDRFTRLALNTSASSAAGGVRGGGASSNPNRKGPRLELSATMHGSLRLALRTDSLRIASTWRGLQNPELDPRQVEGGEEGLRAHPSTRMREIQVDDDDDGDGSDGFARGWAKVRIDARDWSKVLSCGRVGGRVVACFCHDHALILYVYLPGGDGDTADGGADESVLTYYISSYSA